MTVTVTEKFKRKLSASQAQRLYLITADAGEDEIAARTQLQADAPASVNGFEDRVTEVEEFEGRTDAWLGTVTWTPRGVSLPSAGGDVLTFQVGGGSYRITHSLSTISQNPATGFGASDVPDFKGAIGVDEEGGVRGVQLPPPTPFQFSIAKELATDDVNEAYLDTLSDLVWTTNQATFESHAAERCLFVGASGQKRGNGLWTVTYNYGLGRHETSLTPQGFSTGFDKKAWQHLWVHYRTAESTTNPKLLLKRPVAAYVEKVFDVADWSSMFPS